jgi:hypothetical protein
LPRVIELPDAPQSLRGYRRPGPLREAVIAYLDAKVEMRGLDTVQTALDELARMVGWQLDSTDNRGTGQTSGRQPDGGPEATDG